MAIYHLSVSNVSRASGSRATATLSYISGRRVHDERRGETYDYGRKERVLRVGTLLPEGAPAEFADPAVLFNAVELHETGRTARPAKKIVVALPREFTPRQRVQALEEYIRENLNADGYAATYAIHEDREGNNPHAHILVANRQIDPATGGWARLKQRMEYVLDERGERVPLIDPETGRQKTDKRGRRQWKRTSVSLNPLDRKAKLKALRESWAKTCNARLDETARIDHRSLEDQGSDLEPTIHEGYAARAIERAGGVSERCEANREIRRSNGELVDVLPPSEAEDYSVTVSRGCADSNAGCWAGGNALGDMQFAGTGTATGSWPYRNSYTTGNKSGQITFAINGVTYTPVAAGPWMRIATADGSGVDGVSVTRW